MDVGAWPFILVTAARLLQALGEADAASPAWPDGIGNVPPGRRVSVPPILFRKLDAADIVRSRRRFAGPPD